MILLENNMSEVDQEIVAMQKSFEAIKDLEKDVQVRVLIWLKEKLDISQVVIKSGKETGEQGSDGTGSLGSKGNEKDFILGKDPKNRYQLVACAGYFLEEVKKKDSYSTEELGEVLRAARRNDYGILSTTVNDATAKYGYFLIEKGGKRKLTTKGLAVIEALPSEEAVRKISSNLRSATKKKVIRSKAGPNDKA